MKAFLFILFVFSSLNSLSQHKNFEIHFGNSSSLCYTREVIEKDGGYFTFYNAKKKTHPLSFSCIKHFDNAGNEQNSFCFEEGITNFSYKTINDTIYGFGSRVIENDRYEFLMTKISFDFNLVEEYIIDTTDYYFMPDEVLLVNDEIIIAGDYHDSPFVFSSRLFICKLDKKGNLKRLEFLKEAEMHMSRDLIKVNNTYLYFVWLVPSFDYKFCLTEKFEVESYEHHTVLGRGSVELFSDTTYLTYGEYYYGPSNEYGIEFGLYNNSGERVFQKREKGQGNMINIAGTERGFDFSGDTAIFWTATAMKDNGYATTNPYEGRDRSYIVIGKSDRNTLEKKWEQYYSTDSVFYIANYITATCDGGAAVTGSYYDFNGDTIVDIFLLKVDSNGNLFPNSNEEQPAITARETMVYPNPGYGELSVRKAAQHKQLKFCLYNAAGVLVLEETLQNNVTSFNTESLPAGTYFYKITGENNFQESGKWIKL